MNITVDFDAGTDILDACNQAKQFAILNNLGWVRFKFNGISVSISKLSSPYAARDKYLEALKVDSKIKHVIE